MTKTALDVLEPYHSWQLHRVSPTTFPQDVVVTVRRHQDLTDKELKAMWELVRSRTCYRCRIGKGRFYFGKIALDAANAAVAGETKRRKT